MFQSTHPHGVRPFYLRLLFFNESFNPHTRMGCDSISPKQHNFKLGFQSTHPHGVRLLSINFPYCLLCRFQSTHPHGVRLDETYINYQNSLFQSTHPHGVRRNTMFILAKKSDMFQSTHPHGVRQYIQKIL